MATKPTVKRRSRPWTAASVSTILLMTPAVPEPTMQRNNELPAPPRLQPTGHGRHRAEQIRSYDVHEKNANKRSSVTMAVKEIERKNHQQRRVALKSGPKRAPSYTHRSRYAPSSVVAQAPLPQLAYERSLQPSSSRVVPPASVQEGASKYSRINAELVKSVPVVIRIPSPTSRRRRLSSSREVASAPAPAARTPAEVQSPPNPRRIIHADGFFPPLFDPKVYQGHASLQTLPIPAAPRRNTLWVPPYEIVGPPSLSVYRLKLPANMMHLLDRVVLLSESFAATLQQGWKTDLYSLTKQDLALMEIPGMRKLIQPIYSYIKRAIVTLYGARSIHMDRNQPHILKYAVSAGHTGVELHHDRCDVTANLVMSRRSSYRGGGTFIPDAGQILRSDYGEFILHPGNLVHGGMDITAGTRYIMVVFAHLNKSNDPRAVAVPPAKK